MAGDPPFFGKYPPCEICGDAIVTGDEVYSVVSTDHAVPSKVWHTRHAQTENEVLLHRAAEWRRQFVADHGTGYDDDPTFRLIRDLAQALETCTRGK